MNRSAPLGWLPIATGAVVGIVTVSSVLYQVFHVTYETQTNTADIAAMRSELATVRANDAAIKAMQRDFNEVETEICELDNLRNLMHAQDQRNYAVLHEKVFGSPYQIGNAFYPQVCRRTSTGKPQ